MLSATHTHTGPVLDDQSVRDEPDGGQHDLVVRYTEGLPTLIARAVVQAQSNLGPARVCYARAEERQLAYNRRFWMKDGTVGWNPGKLNPNTIRPAGPIDPEVGVVYFVGPE